MAYDSHAAYEPPRRAYYGADKQQAPGQDGHGYGHGRQYGGQASSDQTRHDQLYRPQQYDDLNQGQANGYHDGYSQDVRGQSGHTQPNGVGRAGPNGYYEQDPRRQQRPYDPRYQQRPDRGRQDAHDQPPHQPRQRRPSDRHEPQLRPRPDPRHARQYPQEAPPQQQRQQTDQFDQSRSRSKGPTKQSSQFDLRYESHNAAMDEWKARERERMHSDPMSPETKPWDNAFPVFPAIQQKRDRSRPATADRSGVVDGGQPRDSGVHTRPTTSGAGSGGGRPAMPRGHSYDYDTRPQTASVNGLRNHETSRSAEAINQRPEPSRQVSPPQSQSAYARQAVGEMTDVHQRRQQQGYAQHRSRPSDPQDPRYASQPQMNNSYSDPHMQPEVQYHAISDTVPQQQQNYRQDPSRPSMPHINTSAPQESRRAAYLDHQPLSPASVPPRPSTTQGSRGVPTAIGSPMRSQFSPPQNNVQGAPQAATQRPEYSEAGIGYKPYQAPINARSTAPQSREEEIEAEMPDFDSAAPSQTSMLHKRNQTVDRHLNEAPKSPSPPMPSIPQQYSTGGYAGTAERQQGFGQQQEPQAMSQPDPRMHNSSPNYTGMMVDGVQQQYGQVEQNGQSYGSRPMQPRQRQPPEPQPPSHRQGPAPPQPGPAPFQPPFANENGTRHSMDDAREMPYRQGPPSSRRMRENGQPNRGPSDRQPQSQRRPHMDRNASVQTQWSDPGQGRTGGMPFGAPTPQPNPRSAPPTRAGPPPGQATQMPRNNHPDALPHHPTPVRPGLIDQGDSNASRPPPVRNHGNAPAPQNNSLQRQQSVDQASRPVTLAELDNLRSLVNAQPNNHKQALFLAKRLVEASNTLAVEAANGDPRQAAKKREEFIFEAHKWVKKLVGAGYPEAQFYLADCYGSGLLGLEPDTKEAFNLYQAAAKAGHGQAAYRTAVCCELGPEEGGGTRRDYAKALQWYRRGATLGDGAAMYKLGIILLRGLLGQTRNVGEAVTWLKRAVENADTDNPHALHELALLYEPTNTNEDVRNKVVADSKYAFELFQRAANMGHKVSQFRLGQAYEYGTMDLPIDNKASIGWYSKAAAQGEHQAELALSGWYLTGAEGILEHNDTEAYLWARKAASSEPPLAKAMFAMGYFTEMGIGCPASLEEAKRWYGRAASYKFPKAQERLEELRRNPGKPGANPVPLANSKLTRKDQKKDEAECVVM